MLKLSKKVEYGIIAVQYLASKCNETVSAKEMAEDLGLSFDFMSKTLQSMLRNGVLKSQQGTRGGYCLAKSPEEITLTNILHSLNEKPALVDCLNDESEICSIYENCSLRSPINIIQKKIDDLFNETFITELLTGDVEQNKKLNISLEKVKNG